VIESHQGIGNPLPQAAVRLSGTLGKALLTLTPFAAGRASETNGVALGTWASRWLRPRGSAAVVQKLQPGLNPRLPTALPTAGSRASLDAGQSFAGRLAHSLGAPAGISTTSSRQFPHEQASGALHDSHRTPGLKNLCGESPVCVLENGYGDANPTDVRRQSRSPLLANGGVDACDQWCTARSDCLRGMLMNQSLPASRVAERPSVCE